MKLNTYLNYGGNCEQAFRFYEKHLGGKITAMMTHDQAPDTSQMPPGPPCLVREHLSIVFQRAALHIESLKPCRLAADGGGLAQGQRI
jgi:PhnB protein